MAFVEFAQTYGLLGLGALLIAGLLTWGVIHRAAAPGKQVSLLWGFATYHKREQPAPVAPAAPVVPKFTPISIEHEATKTLWRIMQPPSRWIDADLTRLSASRVDDVIAGPHCRKCKLDLSYLDTSGTYGRYRVLRKCPHCDAQLLPKGLGDDRQEMRAAVLTLLQQAHLQGEEIKAGLEI